MSDIQLFRLAGGIATEIKGSTADLEKPLQTLIEANLDRLRDVRGEGHWGTGNTGMIIANAADLERAKTHLLHAYGRDDFLGSL